MEDTTAPAPSTPQAPAAKGPDPGVFGVVDEGRAERIFAQPKPENKADTAAPAAPESNAAAGSSDPSGVGTIGGGEETSVPAKYKWAGREWDSQDAAEHSYKTLSGMHKALLQKEQEARLRALELQREVETLKAGAPAPKPEPKGQPAGGQADSEDGINWQLVQVLREKHGAEFAERYLAEENSRLLQERLDRRVKELEESLESRLSERYGPLVQNYEDQQQTYAVAQMIQTMSDYRMPGGSEPAFPELSDPEALEQIGIGWKELGMPPEALSTPQGMWAAIQCFRGRTHVKNYASRAASEPKRATTPAMNDPGVVSTAGDAPANRDPGQRVNPSDAVLADIRRLARPNSLGIVP